MRLQFRLDHHISRKAIKSQADQHLSDHSGRYKLRLSDQRLLTPSADEIFVQADISKLPDVLRISKEADAIVHLGGYADEGPWETILRSNIVGCYNVFEAARLNSVKRVVFASSNHILGFYRCDQKLDHHVYPKPDSRYGVSKVFGEMLGSLYAYKHGLEIFLIRIGHATPTPSDVRDLAMWISPRDLAQLVGIGIDHPNVHFEIVYGVSGNTRSWYDNTNAERLGYRPLDNAESYAAEVLAQKGSVTERRHYQGGSCTQID
jgi:uronate dehydrogenase